MISLAQQIQEVERELDQRSKVYPRLVSKGGMRQSEADYHTARMNAVLNTLRWIRKHEARVRAQLGEGEQEQP